MVSTLHSDGIVITQSVALHLIKMIFFNRAIFALDSARTHRNDALIIVITGEALFLTLSAN